MKQKIRSFEVPIVFTWGEPDQDSTYWLSGWSFAHKREEFLAVGVEYARG
jgi:hypothetical protein